MSMELMVKAMKAKVGNPLRKLVLIKLADNANDQGECWPSYQHVADQCEISRSTVKVHIRELEKAGLLRREFRRKGDLNQSNLYHLLLDREASNDPWGGAADTPPGAAENPGGGAAAAPRTSHSFEPVKEPKPMVVQKASDGFDQFWKLYPKKTKRKDAAKAWEKLSPSPELQRTMLAALAKWAVCQDWTKEGGKYVPHPSTWLNGERWDDQLPPTASTRQSHHTNLDEVDLLDGLEEQPDGTFRVARTKP